MSSHDVVIIGGGAGGLAAGIAAAHQAVSVTIIEAAPRVGRSILASGNGRCNLSNLAVSSDAYNNPGFVAPVISRFPCDAVRSFFGDMGLLTTADEEGRIYPATYTASSVLDVLRLECEHLGVDVRCDLEVAQVVSGSAEGRFDVVTSSGELFSASAVVVATGGGTTLLAETGHAQKAMSPVLGPLCTQTEPIKGLSGIRVRCAATLIDSVGDSIAAERGELLFRDYGVSGIMVFNLSRFLQPGCFVSIDFFPDVDSSDLEAVLRERAESSPWRHADSFFTGMLHDRVAKAVLKACRVDLRAEAATLPHHELAAVLKDFRLPVTGMGPKRQAQVTRGGADVAEFDANTMQSRRVSGLFAAGEVLDIDGPSGGFNLHWAWASGIVAGQGAALHARPDASGAEVTS